MEVLAAIISFLGVSSSLSRPLWETLGQPNAPLVTYLESPMSTADRKSCPTGSPRDPRASNLSPSGPQSGLRGLTEVDTKSSTILCPPLVRQRYALRQPAGAIETKMRVPRWTQKEILFCVHPCYPKSPSLARGPTKMTSVLFSTFQQVK